MESACSCACAASADLARGEGVADELVRSEQRLGFAEVVRELGRVLIGVVPVERLERLGDPRVEAHPSA